MKNPVVLTKGLNRTAKAAPEKKRNDLWFFYFFLLFLGFVMFSVFYFWLALYKEMGMPEVEMGMPEVLRGISLTTRNWGADSLILAVAVFLILLFLTSLPLFLVMRYKRVEYDKLVCKLRLDLGLCGFRREQVDDSVEDFQAKNSWSAYFFPTLVMTFYLYLMFGTILLSHGVYGVVVSFSDAACLQTGAKTGICTVGMVNIPQFLFNLPRAASPLSWAFLGAYFYAIAVLFRRWQRSDLTAGTLWKLTARFAVAFILGLLLTKIVPAGEAPIEPSIAFPETITLESIDDNWAVSAAMIAFIIGIVPDGFLNRIFTKVRRFIQDRKNPFTPSDLQEKIDGLNFWQEDRLMEEGIESVEDLALTDITDLLVKIRFDTPHLLFWVDQALLSHQAKEHFSVLKEAHVLSATDLLYLTGHKEDSPVLERSPDQGKLKTVWSSLGGASWDREDLSQGPISYKSFVNIVYGLHNTPNVPYVWSYMTNTRDLKRRADREAELRKPPHEAATESKQLLDSNGQDNYYMILAEIENGLGW
jgi:hypothetical protein